MKDLLTTTVTVINFFFVSVRARASMIERAGESLRTREGERIRHTGTDTDTNMGTGNRDRQIVVGAMIQ